MTDGCQAIKVGSFVLKVEAEVHLTKTSLGECIYVMCIYSIYIQITFCFDLMRHYANLFV